MPNIIWCKSSAQSAPTYRTVAQFDFDANENVELNNNSQAISWSDTVSGMNLISNVLSSTPIYYPNAGIPYVSFQEGEFLVDDTSGESVFGPLVDGFTFFAVFRPIGDRSSIMSIDEYTLDNSTPGNDVSISIHTLLNNELQVSLRNLDVYESRTFTTVDWTENDFVLLSATFNQSGNSISVFKNGNPANVLNSNSGFINLGGLNNNTFERFSFNSLSTDSLGGDISEFVAYNQLLSDSERESYENQLMSKWNLS